MLSRRAILALLLGLIVGAFTHDRGFQAIDRVRLKVVETATPSANGVVRIPSTDLNALAHIGQPVALILRARNNDAHETVLTATVDGRTACHYALPASRTQRTDCAVTLDATADSHVVELTGSPGNWTLEYLEVATHHGNTTGPIYLVILPHDSTLAVPASLRFLALFSIASFAACLLIPAWRLPRWAARTHLGLCAIVILMALVVWLAPAVSAFRVVVAEWTVVLWALVILAPQLTSALVWLAGTNKTSVSTRDSFARATGVALLVLLVFWQPVRLRLADFGGNYSGFAMISERAFDVNPLVKDRVDLRASLRLLDNGGYDGQFAYFAAFDPLMRAFRDNPHAYRDVVDAVPYRFGRIGLSALTHVAAMGHPERYPAAMVWIVLLALAVSAFALSLLAQHRRHTALAGALIVLVPGFWQSLQTALPEPLAAAALIGAVLCLMHERVVLAGALFAASLLVRETGVLLVLCAAGELAIRGKRRDAMVLASIAIVPMLLWRGYVGWTIYADWGLRGFLDHPADLTVPLAGIVDLWRTIAGGTYADGTAAVARAGTTFPLLLIFALITSIIVATARPSVVSIAAVLYALLGVSLNYEMIWVHVGNGQRGTYELFVALAIVTAALRRDSPRQVRVCLTAFWVASAAYIFFGGFDAEFIRTALSWPT